MTRQTPKKETPRNTVKRPAGNSRCACRGTGKCDVMVNSQLSGQLPGHEPWVSSVRFNNRLHCLTVLCLCALGRWIKDCYEIAGGKAPYLDYDQRTMRLESEFMRELIPWERGGMTGPAPRITP